ncbi:MAG: hypothetical protein ACI3XA_05625 [Clostridia bacterium]
MGRGKTDSSSQSAYTDKTNENINNKIFESKRSIAPERAEERKSLSYYSRYFLNSNNKICITRNPLTTSDKDARKKFLALINNFEKTNSMCLKDTSKNELIYAILHFAEHENALILVKDDSKQFLPFRFLFPDALKLYFYKMFYPMIFDYETIRESEVVQIKFLSEYIEENFISIYQQIEMLGFAIVYDALLIAIERSASKQVASIKKYKVELNPSDDIENIKDYLENELSVMNNVNNDARAPILKEFIPSAIFLSRHYYHLYKNREIKERLLTTVLNSNTFYIGKRADDSRNALISAYAECAAALNDNSQPFSRLLNLYYINKRSYVYDLNILKGNVEFMPFLLDGIVTKHHINSVIIDNNKKINITSSERLTLSSIHNNPNCIIDNLSFRDYEMLDFIISRTARTMQAYYLMEDDKDVPPSRLCELIRWLNREPLTKTINSIVGTFDRLYTNNVDYDMVLKLSRVFPKGDGNDGLK